MKTYTLPFGKIEIDNRAPVWIPNGFRRVFKIPLERSQAAEALRNMRKK